MHSLMRNKYSMKLLEYEKTFTAQPSCAEHTDVWTRFWVNEVKEECGVGHEHTPFVLLNDLYPVKFAFKYKYK